MVMAGNSELNTVNEWFGTYETRVAEKAECPVLVLPQKPVYKPVKNILYIADLNDETVENMRTLTTICKSLNAHLTMAVVSDQVKEKDMEFVTITKTFRQLLGYDEVTYHQIFSDGITETIARLTQKTNANWLAFEQKNKSFFKRLFDDYNTKRLILQSEIPVLVF